MTLTEKYELIVRLRCCSALLADSISTELQKGGCNDTTKLILLNDLLELITTYTLSEDATIPNCIDADEFEEVVAKATNICDLCDCDN